MRIAAASALLVFLLSAGAVAAIDFVPGDQPRLDAARMQSLVEVEIALARKGRLKDAQRLLDRRIAAQKAPLARADLLEAFGVELYAATPSLEQRAAIEAAADYLARGAMAYRLLLGNDHPELATALVRQAEMERLLRPQEPGLSADIAYETAYRIRAAKLGPRAITTLSTLIPMAQIKALPSRARGDPAKLQEAAALLRQVVEGTAQSSNPQAVELHADAIRALHALDAEYGAAFPSGRRRQLLTPDAATTCGAGSPDDVMTFSGDADALGIIRKRFARARLTLRPCGALLLFPFSPGVDPSPVLDLLSDISEGRMKGVRMDLIEGSRTTGR